MNGWSRFTNKPATMLRRCISRQVHGEHLNRPGLRVFGHSHNSAANEQKEGSSGMTLTAPVFSYHVGKLSIPHWHLAGFRMGHPNALTPVHLKNRKSSDPLSGTQSIRQK